MEPKNTAKQALVYEPSKVSWASVHYIETEPSLAVRLLVYILLSVLSVGIVYANFTQFAVDVEARGQLMPDNLVFIVHTSTAGQNMTVARLFVKNYQSINKGDPLVSGEDHLSDKEYASIADQTKSIQSLVERDKTNKCPDCLVKLRAIYGTAFQQRTSLLKDYLPPIQQDLKDWYSSLNDLSQFADITFADRRTISLDQRRLKEIGKRGVRQMLHVEVDQLEGEIATAQSDIASKKQTQTANLLSARSKVEVALANLMVSIDKFQTEQLITAPITGIVTNLRVAGAGQTLADGSEVLSIVPKDSALHAEVQVANKDIARVKVGLSAKVKLDAFPDNEFEMLSGTVKEVPPNVDDNTTSTSSTGSSTSSTSAAPADSTYNVHISLPVQGLAKDGANYPFKLGMTCDVHIITKHETLIQMAARELFQIKDQVFGASVD